jgi:putative transposase
LIDPKSELSVRRQCELLGVGRSGLYYEPEATSTDELALMRRIDELHLKHPFYGSRNIAHTLSTEGTAVNRKCVQRLMRVMDLQSLAPKPSTSRPAPEHKKYPYLLRNLKICLPNQVWATDITYIPLALGFAYLVAIMDWYTRRVLAWRLSSTLETAFCIEALQEALRGFPQPDIFNTDQGAQFTDDAFTRVLLGRGIKVSMDGKGRCIDNIFVERLWRSVKYEEVYLHAYDSPREARAGIGRYMKFYNFERPHQSLGYQTPDAFYRGLTSKAA